MLSGRLEPWSVRPARRWINRALTLGILMWCSVLLLGSPASGQPDGGPTESPANMVDATTAARLEAAYAERQGKLDEKARTAGAVRVIVELKALFQPEGLLADARARNAQRAGISSHQSELENRLIARFGARKRAVTRFETLPFIALDVNEAELAALRSDPTVASIEEDAILSPQLFESVPLIGADVAHDLGYKGAGQVVAVIDTGVLQDHPFLASQVVEEACYGTNSALLGLTSLCPGGAEATTDAGSARDCPPFLGNCGHGTHVAGIAAGKATLTEFGSMSGVAPDARLIAIKAMTFSSVDGDATPSTSNTVKGLERVFQLKDYYQIAAVNLSLGGGKYTDAAACDSSQKLQKAAIDQLRSAGIATVAAAGNNGWKDALYAPACISSAVSVGAVTKYDEVASYSNTAGFLKLLAPGGDGDYRWEITPIFSSGVIAGAAEAMYRHTCGVRNDGTVVCWGSNSYGEATPPAGEFIQVSGSYDYTCGVRSDRQLICWGASSVLTQPPTGNYSAVDAGFSHACALLQGVSTAVCWGSNYYGEASPPSNAFAQISAGFDQTCGVKTMDSTVLCWGGDQDGQSTPPSGTFLQVSAGTYRTCGVRSDGKLVCWGDNSYWNGSSSVVVMPPEGSFTQVSAGSDHNCALRTNGTLACWGSNAYGQSTPPAGTFTQVSAGKGHSCAVHSDGLVVCWGRNEDGEANPPAGHAWQGFQFIKGTSMAAPHVTGAWAVLKSKKPDASVDEIFDALRNTGIPIVDILSGNSFPRIDIPAALAALDNLTKLTVNKAGTGSGRVTSAPAGIDCGSDCTGNFPGGTGVTLTATAGKNSVFTRWSGACTGTQGCVVTLDEAKAVTAMFTKTYPLIVAKTGAGSGTVVGQGIDCGDYCTKNFAGGTLVTLTAKPAEGSTFLGWSGSSEACSGSGACTVKMNSAKNITATFGPAPPNTHALGVVVKGEGSVASKPAGISCGSQCSATFATGSKVMLTATPAAGFIFKNWSGACLGAKACTVTMGKNKQVTAQFVRK